MTYAKTINKRNANIQKRINIYLKMIDDNEKKKMKNEKTHYKIVDKRENASANRIKLVQHSNEIEINNEKKFCFRFISSILCRNHVRFSIIRNHVQTYTIVYDYDKFDNLQI